MRCRDFFRESEKERMLITSMNSGASALLKNVIASSERDDYTVGRSTGSYRARLHLNASATGGNKVYLSRPGALRRMFVITGDALLTTRSFHSFWNKQSPPLLPFRATAILLPYCYSVRCDALTSSGRARCKVARAECTRSGATSIISRKLTTDISCVAYVFHSHTSSAKRLQLPRPSRVPFHETGDQNGAS